MPPLNENNEEQKPIDEVVADAVEHVADEVKKDDRPEINYKAELERRRASEERLRQELEVEKSRQVKRYDPNDMSTWSDTDLKAVKNTQDPQYLHLKDRAEEELLERKVTAIRERERLNDKRTQSEMALRTQFPEALDPYSPFAAAMEKVMFDYDLQKSPAGRLAAAKIVAAEYRSGSGKADAAGRKKEEARLKDVKQTLSEGDRPDPRSNIPSNKKNDELIAKINNPKARNEDVGAAMGDLLKSKGMDMKSFFGR